MRTGLFTAARPGGRIDRPDAGAGAVGLPQQLGFDEIGTPLFDATFVVVDLETTGGSATESAITEIGAVKVRGGETVGEFQTLVNPGVGIPPTITVLTGITNAMVLTAPRISTVLPAFLEFVGDAVLVAHNARFDVGFLKANAARLDLLWPRPKVVDTLALARRVVTREEAPNHKLGTLAALFQAQVAPDHRALTDARATVDVLHGLFARMSSLGLTHVEDLATASDPVPPARRRKVTLADDLPTCPGVYLFLGPRREVLYVGTATNLRRRVRSYFTAAEKRARIGEMVDLATAVKPIPCATPLEAAVRELRAIAEHDPRYNRRSKAPGRRPWVRLTAEAYPRLSVARTAPRVDAGAAIGPFPSRASAALAVEAVVAATGLRTCTATLPRVPKPGGNACILLELGRCSAPCVHPETDYGDRVVRAEQVLGGDADAVVEAMTATISRLSAQERFEEAAVRRDQLLAYLRTAARAERLDPLRRARQILAARRAEAGGWEIVLLRYGRFAGTAVSTPGRSPMPVVDSLRQAGEQVEAADTRAGAATDEETALLADWLERPGTRLIESDLDFAGEPGWSLPVRGAARHLDRLTPRP